MHNLKGTETALLEDFKCLVQIKVCHLKDHYKCEIKLKYI